MKSKICKIDAMLNGLSKSVDNHYRWLVDMMAFTLNQHRRGDADSFKENHNHCCFGIWLNEQLHSEKEDRGFLLEIHNCHATVHNHCRKIISEVYDRTHEQSLFDEFALALQEFIHAISSYQTYLLQLRSGYDELTELPLRRLLDESYMKQQIDETNGYLYLMVIDIDHFKNINDKYGHAAGDDVLRIFSKNLEANTREYEHVYRYGGEEFVITLKAFNDSEAKGAGLRIINEIEKNKINIGEYSLSVTATSGLTRVGTDELLRVVLERADTAMYIGKQSGRNRCIFISEDGSINNIIQ
jgi:diguanylate cyclase (GGDEF) domain